MIRSVAIVYNDRIDEAISLSQQLERVLVKLKREVRLVKARELEMEAQRLPKLDMLVTLGGDGTILRASRLAARQQAIVLGVNLGQLGFLAELGPADVVAQMPAIIEGAGWIEERMMLRATLHCSGAPVVLDGLNDVVLTRGQRPRAVRVSVAVDGEHLQTFVADGVIVSTPTGSTAYALAMDGPILQPEMRALQVTPLAPHLTVIRSIVLPAGASVALTINTKDPAVASVDGQMDVPVEDGDTMDVTASPLTARFLRLQAHSYFYQTLAARLSTSIVRGLQ